MTITYIGHSGFLFEFQDTLLLFDYYQGQIPELPQDKKLYVFSSHRHQDHFSPQIFPLAAAHPNIQYVLSYDIWLNHVPEELHSKTIQMRPNSDWEDDHIQVHTLRSTDEGVAFLVTCDGQSVFHAGDLNDWRWPGETEDWNLHMAESFRKFLEPLKDTPIDAACLPLDPRQEEYYCLGMDYYLYFLKPRKVYPMHCWDKYSIISRWLKEHAGSPYADSIVGITQKGQQFKQ